jgi:hypothetical protein
MKSDARKLLAVTPCKVTEWFGSKLMTVSAPN